MPPLPTSLPILDRRDEIEAAIRAHRVVVICGETGSGKTTQLPQICLELGLAEHGLIGHTQPRRLAARAVAARIAEERGEALGGLVGVKVRFHEQTSRRTRIKVLTDGMLLAELAGDPRLLAYSTIIIDEAHERSLNIDVILGYLKQLLPRRSDLKVIITSATIDPRRFSDFFGGPGVAPVIEVSGRTYPVEVRHRPTDADEESFDRVEFEAVADAVEELCGTRAGGGDVLVFLPGEREIRLASNAIAQRRLDIEVLPLFSRLTNQEQDRIFHPSGERQRVILSTNVAETSLTVPGIRYVVDTGLARLNRYDPQRKIQRLPVEPISRASAAQRAGRCGRVAAGVCIRLYSEESFRSRPAFTDPEIRRTSLASVILQMKALGPEVGAIEAFPFLDPPDPRAIQDGYETLFELGAITSPGRDGALTEIGQRIARLPLDPRIARMLIGAEREGALDEVVVLSAVLSIQDPRERPMSRQEDADRAQAVFRHESSDFLSLLKLWDQYAHAAANLTSGPLAGWCREHFLSPARMREWTEMVRQLRDVADEIGLKRSKNPASPDAVHRALLTGLISNVACREGDGSFDYRGVRGNVVQIFPGSALFKKGPKWIMAAEVVQTTRLYARTVARIDPTWIEELAGHLFRRQLSDQHLDAETGQPSAWERVSLSGIVVVPRRRTPLAPLDPAGARGIFIREGLAQMKWQTAAGFMEHNREVLRRARAVEAKLRRRDVLAPEAAIAEWFERRVPAGIAEPVAFEAWRIAAEREDPRVLMLGLDDVLQPSALAALDASAFPDAIEIGEGEARVPCAVEYALAPGKDEDGVTVMVPLTSLPELTPERAAWLVPGMLPQVIQALIKTLPKPARAAVEQKGDAAAIAAACAEVVRFGEGSLEAALSEAMEIIHGVKVERGAWSLKSLPPHLRMRVRVVDHAGKEIAAERDVAGLRQRLEGRIRKAQAAVQRATVERHGITSWDFGDLPALPTVAELEASSEAAGSAAAPVAMLLDRGESVSLTLAPAREAAVQTPRGVRRLLALAIREEVAYYIDAFPPWGDMQRQYQALGSAAELRDALTLLIAERTFMDAQPPIRSHAAFEERLDTHRGRLALTTREVADTVAKILEPRAKVAQRLSGGTPRLWAESIADIREHAAYLMPRGFLTLVPWERLRHYPRYAAAMRERLFSLREEGSKAEQAALKRLAPHWKRFTGWVAQTMAEERVRAAEAAAASGEPGAAGGAAGHKKAPLPQARRAAPSVNLEAGEWAMQPGRLAAAVDRYRWALEELRVVVFGAGKGDEVAGMEGEVERLWGEVAR